MPFDTFVQTRIFDPLKMTSSYWTVPASEVGRFATNYVIMGDARTPFDPAATSVYLQKPSFPYGGPRLVMSARDYDRFLPIPQDGGHLDGARIIHTAMSARALTTTLRRGVTVERIGGGERKRAA